jgi:hypothetical protein
MYSRDDYDLSKHDRVLFILIFQNYMFRPVLGHLQFLRKYIEKDIY